MGLPGLRLLRRGRPLTGSGVTRMSPARYGEALNLEEVETKQMLAGADGQQHFPSQSVLELFELQRGLTFVA